MLVAKILWAFLSIGLLGAVLGVGLAGASRYFAVKKDKRIERVEGALPGLNCAACGYAGCEGYAEAIIVNGEDLDLCKPGGSEALAAISDIMGVEVTEAAEKLVAQVHCRGGQGTAAYKYEYHGMTDCNAAHSFFGGTQFNYWGSIAVSLAWVGAVMLLCRAGRPAGLLARLAAVGRMAFSLYIFQTLAATLIFYGHGLGLFGRVERVGQIAIVAALTLLQLWLAPLWLKRFRFGPLEWAWRSLTYFRRQPLRV